MGSFNVGDEASSRGPLILTIVLKSYRTVHDIRDQILETSLRDDCLKVAEEAELHYARFKGLVQGVLDFGNLASGCLIPAGGVSASSTESSLGANFFSTWPQKC